MKYVYSDIPFSILYDFHKICTIHSTYDWQMIVHNQEYRWEGGYEKTWEAIQEDKEGMLDISVQVKLEVSLVFRST